MASYNPRKWVTPLLLSIFFLALSPSAIADTESNRHSMASYVRYLRPGQDTPARFDTSIVRFQHANGKSLDLVSAVHVGSENYYKQLNELFESYDTVLFELIIPEEMVGEKLPAVLEIEGGLSDIQNMMAKTMGLTTQIGSIDYSAENLVRADLTTEQFLQGMRKNRESLFTYLSKMLSEGSSDSELGISDQEFAELSFFRLYRGKPTAKDRKTMRKLFAYTLAEEADGGGIFGDTTLIKDRNLAALETLEEQLKSDSNTFALYYGAAHMPHLASELREKGWVSTSTTWLTAWRI